MLVTRRLPQARLPFRWPTVLLRSMRRRRIFCLKDSQGFNVTLDQFRGKVVLLNFGRPGAALVKLRCGDGAIVSIVQLQGIRDPGRVNRCSGTVVTRPFQQEVGFTFLCCTMPISGSACSMCAPVAHDVSRDRKGIIRNRIPGARDWSAPPESGWSKPCCRSLRMSDSVQSISLVAAFSAGLLSFVSPCVLPLVPSYISLHYRVVH